MWNEAKGRVEFRFTDGPDRLGFLLAVGESQVEVNNGADILSAPEQRTTKFTCDESDPRTFNVDIVAIGRVDPTEDGPLQPGEFSFRALFIEDQTWLAGHYDPETRTGAFWLTDEKGVPMRPRRKPGLSIK